MKVTIIGIGGLGSAIAAGLVGAVAAVDAAGDEAIALTLCGRREASIAPFAERARTTTDARRAVADADVVVLAVKPAHTPALLADVSSALAADAVVVSCAAGVPLSRLLGHAAVARAMPNIGALRAASTTALCLGTGCVVERDLPRLRRVFQAVGSVREVADEKALHAITAVGASGPAFVLLAIEALADGGVEAGLPRAEAVAWARGALLAAAARLDDGTEPQAIRALVTSPAGTTAAGLGQLEEHGARAAYLAAVRAAVARSRELA
jgi:pyrroline-5-carboxylate reductase